MTVTERKPDFALTTATLYFALTTATPYIALTGDLWGVFYDYFEKYLPRYNGIQGCHCPFLSEVSTLVFESHVLTYFYTGFVYNKTLAKILDVAISCTIKVLWYGIQIACNQTVLITLSSIRHCFPINRSGILYNLPLNTARVYVCACAHNLCTYTRYRCALCLYIVERCIECILQLIRYMFKITPALYNLYHKNNAYASCSVAISCCRFTNILSNHFYLLARM